MIRKVFIVIATCALVAESSALISSRSSTSNDTCGFPKTTSERVMYGENFPRGSFPWIIALMYTGSSPPKFFCAGTLISKSFVISAAHCIQSKREIKKLKPHDILAFFGAHNFTDPYEAGRYQLTPKTIFVHEDWNYLAANYDADLSLLEFDTDSIHFNLFIQPICVWESETEPNVTEGKFSSWIKAVTGGALMSLKAATKEFFCDLKVTGFTWSANLHTCMVNRQTIDSESYVLGSPADASVERFHCDHNDDMKFLPRLIGEKFPNLYQIWILRCGLTVLRNHYFEKMENLDSMYLDSNQIASIESEAFRDLTSLTTLDLHNNVIETLPEKLFKTMTSLENILLNSNRINKLSPTIFTIPGGQLKKVQLGWNVCIHENYYSDDYESNSFKQLKSDLRTKCTGK